MNYKTPPEIAKSAVAAAISKTSLPLLQMTLLGFLAGVYIAMGGYFMIVVTQDAAAFAGIGISKLLGGIVFSLGLFLVVAAGAELFTGNCLMPIGLLAGKISWSGMLRNLSVVYAANFAGALFFALLIFKSGVLSKNCADYALSIAAAKVRIPLSQMILRGLLCNWFVGLAVWLTFGALDMSGKFIALLMPITAFVAMGFEHCVANMFFLPLGLMIKSGLTAAGAPIPAPELTIGSIFGNLIPVTIGNIIGAAFFLGVLYFVIYRRDIAKD
ncbi:formate/nitrite transporter family protein [Cloacibacillus porcorum]|uniref:formate/nitrite transporter family protein n=1 Tax=Cloacibacillus porcorum TaxID=1197717 RepID=UPI003D08400F